MEDYTGSEVAEVFHINGRLYDSSDLSRDSSDLSRYGRQHGSIDSFSWPLETTQEAKGDLRIAVAFTMLPIAVHEDYISGVTIRDNHFGGPRIRKVNVPINSATSKAFLYSKKTGEIFMRFSLRKTELTNPFYRRDKDLVIEDSTLDFKQR